MPTPPARDLLRSPGTPPALAHADDVSLREFGEGDWTLLASLDLDAYEWEDRVRQEHMRISALCREEDLVALDAALGRGGEFGHLGVGQHPGPTYDCLIGDVVVEPLAHRFAVWPGRPLHLNPGLPAMLNLRGRQPAENEVVYFDERLAQDVVRMIFEAGPRRLTTIRIRTPALRRFLADREQALVTYHFHQVLLRRFQPDERAQHEEIEGITLGHLTDGLKTTIQNWAKPPSSPDEAYLQRRVHRWMVLRPRRVDRSNWKGRHAHVDFDVAAFTLPTRHGKLAPGRFAELDLDHDTFAGAWPVDDPPEFMTPVFFDQAVLQRFEQDANYTVDDQGGIHCGCHWGLTRSTRRVGNKWIRSAIGDFAQGVPLEEWPYFQRFAVAFPDRSAMEEADQEVPIPEAVNQLLRTLDSLVRVGDCLAGRLSVEVSPVWERKGVDAIAVMKRWMAEFVDKRIVAERVTALSCVVLDGLCRHALMTLCEGVCGMRASAQFREHGSRKWLEHLAGIFALARDLGTLDPGELAVPARVGLGWVTPLPEEEELAAERRRVVRGAREALAPIAVVYDLRTGGGVAHPESHQWENGMRSLGINNFNLGRRTYLGLLSRVQCAVQSIVLDAERAIGVK